MQETTTWPFEPRKNPIGPSDGTVDVCLPLKFTSAAATSKLYGSIPSELRGYLASENITPNYHRYCLTFNTYSSSRELSEFYTVTTTNMDTNGVEFVSSFEAKHYPFYGVQFHPEVINYLHNPNYDVNNSLHAVLIAQYYGNFLVAQAKLNNNTFASYLEEERFLINRYPSMYDDYYQYYCFSDSDMPTFD